MSESKNQRFIKARDKYSDMRSSASSLLIVGILGIIYLVIDYMDVLPFSIIPNDNWLFSGVMLVMFLVFTIAGVYTYASAKKLKNTISSEEELTENIRSWILENIKAVQVDALCESNRKDAYDNAISDCLEDEAETPEDINEDEYDIVSFESFYDIPEEMKAFEREEAIIQLTQAEFKDASVAHISFILEDLYDTIFTL